MGGVTNYLTGTAVDSTLRWIGSSGPRNEVVFTYVHRGVIDDTASFGGTQRLDRTLARVGEGWTFGLDPAEIRTYLAARGLELLGDPGSGYEFYRVARARVVG